MHQPCQKVVACFWGEVYFYFPVFNRKQFSFKRCFKQRKTKSAAALWKKVEVNTSKMEPNFVNTGDQQRLSFSSLSSRNEKIINYGHISIGVLLLAITVSFLANMCTWMNFIHAVLIRKCHKIYYCTTFGRNAKPLYPNPTKSEVVLYFYIVCYINS